MRSAHGRPSDLGINLTEVVLVVALLGLLLAVATASYVTSVRYANRTICDSKQRELTRAVPAFEAHGSGRPPATIDDLRPYVRDFESSSKCPEDGRPLVYSLADGAVLCTYPGH